MTTHELKTWPAPFAAILDGSKNYEIRRFDRPFLVGDVLHLREWRPCDAYPECDHPTCRDGEYTGRDLRVTVTYLTPGGEWGLPDDLCVMSIARPGSATTTPTDLLARLRAVLTAAEAMTPGPWTVHLPSSLDRDDLAHIETPDRTCEWQWFAWDEPGAEENMRGLVALRNATADLAALLALVEAPVSVPTWTVEPFGDGLTRHTITRGRVRLTVRSGYDDGMTHGEIAIVYGPGRDDVIRKSWFGGGNRTAEESLAEAKAGTLAMAREIGAVALVETPAGVEPTCACGSRLVGGVPGDAARFGWVCYECRLAKVDLADGTPLTVGAALADPRVQDGSHVVEYRDGGMWRQLRSAKREALSTRAFRQGFRGSPPERAMSWSAWMSTRSPTDSAEVWAEEYALPCRLVPLTDADRDPATRGPL